MWYSLLVVLCLHFDSAIAQPCPSGWTYINATNACYQMTETNFDYNTSWAMCQAAGANLMSITNQAEMQWIIATMIPFGVPSGENAVWVGAVDLTGTGSFQWTDGQPFNTSLWATGEPIAGNNCGYWQWTLPHLPYNGNLFTQPCTFPHWFACKKNTVYQMYPLERSMVSVQHIFTLQRFVWIVRNGNAIAKLLPIRLHWFVYEYDILC